jgi:DNA-binding IclR family transcriptional regulator
MLGVESRTTTSPSVLSKAFVVLDTFNHTRRVLTLSDIARRSGLPKSTVHRVLAMLLDVGAVERAGQGYRVGLRMFSLVSCSTEAQLRDVALPHLERLRRITRQTVHLGVLEGAEVVYLEKLVSHRSPPTPAMVGGRLRAASTGVGKALLAFSRGGVGSQNESSPLGESPDFDACLRDVRVRGVAADREEVARGLACAAVPIIVGNQVVAAVSVGFEASAGSGELFTNPLRETAAAVSRALATLPGGYCQIP